MNHTMRREDHSDTTNWQRRQQAQQTREKTTENPIRLTDYILNFRAACLNRSVDIRNFAEGRDSFVINSDERKCLRESTEMLTEQIEFLQDAWNTMLRCAKEYDIDLDRNNAFRALELTRNHALRVAEQAFSIWDQFLFPQTVGNHYDADRQKRERRPKQAHSKTTEEGKNIGYLQETKEKRYQTPQTANRTCTL